MKNIKEKLNENIIDDQKIDEGALDYQVKKMTKAQVPYSIINILQNVGAGEKYVPFDDFIDIICKIYEEK